MKNAFFATGATLLFFFTLHTSADAQRVATWKGGAPGRGAAWGCAQNWKEGRVPDEFSDVLVPDVSTTSRCQPRIEGLVEPVNSLTLLSGAQLRIAESGMLEILGWAEIFGAGSIDNDGVLNMPEKTREQRELVKIADN